MVPHQPSSQRGDRDYSANRALAARCLATPDLIEQVVAGLAQAEPEAIADCADVLAEVADSWPDLVAPHGESLVAPLDHPKQRVRWEAMRAPAFIAGSGPI